VRGREEMRICEGKIRHEDRQQCRMTSWLREAWL
jgi:hypothetical protein